MPLTNIQAKQAKPKEKSYKLSDSGGIYLEVTTKGHRYWRLKYRFNGKEKRLAIGVYPSVSLKDARNARDATKELLAQGADPSQQKQADKLKKQICADSTFEKIGRLWIESKSHEWSKAHT